MNSSSPLYFEILRSIPELSDVPDSQLNWLLANSEMKTFQTGELVVDPASLPEHTYIIMDGTIEMFIQHGENKDLMFQFHKGAILGYLPFSDDIQSSTYGQAVTPSSLLTYPKSKIQSLVSHNPDLTRALVRILVNRTQNFTTQTLQNEKMLALGKLSAGLSHELNNPIASIERDSFELGRLFTTGNLLNLMLSDIGLDAAEKSMLRQAINSWTQAKRPTGTPSSEILKLEKKWLKKLKLWGMKNPDEAAEVFTDSGIDPDEVSVWVKKIEPERVDAWLNGVQFLLQSQALVKTVQDASERVKSLISAVKTFTHVGRASSRTKLSLSKGIEDTLIILSHKLKKIGVEVSFSKPEEPVFIKGYPSELNQVWTNLIDNAIDALEDIKNPKLEIKIIPQANSTAVLIRDNGSGISDEIQSRIFEPFFTTKGIGKGSGMGLDLVNQIILKHGGTILVDSVPGQTTFRLDFPNT